MEASFDIGWGAVVGAGLSLRGAAQGVETESSAWDARGAGFNNPGMDAGLGVGDSETAVDSWETRAGDRNEATLCCRGIWVTETDWEANCCALSKSLIRGSRVLPADRDTVY